MTGASIVDELDIRRAYLLVTGVAADAPERGGHVRVRCPCVDHPDEHPSCDLSPTRGTFVCRACGAAGGKLDLPVVAGIANDRAIAAQFYEQKIGGAATPSGRSNGKPKPAPRVVSSFVYADRGEDIARVDRVEPGRSKAKDFFPHLSDGNGGFTRDAGLNGTILPLYRVDEVRAAAAAGEAIFLVEGEGKGDRLRERLAAAGSNAAVTTIAGGSNAKMHAEHLEAFAGSARVVVLADSDAPGRTAAAIRATQIASRTPALDVRIVDLFPERSDGSDIADWLAEGHDLRQLYGLVLTAPVVQEEALSARRDSEPLALPHGLTLKATTNGKLAAAQFVSVGDLLRESDEEVPQLVEGVLRCGSTVLVASKPKVGKTSWLMNLGLSVARGTPFLGRPTKQGVVLYVALEGNRNEWRSRFKAMGAGEDEPLLICIGQAPQDAMRWLHDNANEHKPILIIIDTLQRLARLKDMNDYAAVTNASEPLIAIAQTFNATLALAHHSKKRAEGDDGDEVLGSTALFGFVDTLVALKKGTEGRRTMATVQRYGDSMDEIVLAIDPLTKRIAAVGARADVDRAACEVDILKALAAMEDWADRATILVDVDARASTKNAALKQVVDDGRVERIGAGRKGDPHLYAVAGRFASPSRSESEKDSFPVSPRSNGNQQNESDKTLRHKDLFDSRPPGFGDENDKTGKRILTPDEADSGNVGNAGFIGNAGTGNIERLNEDRV